ncbi:uncharacterized protein C8A04DRAFT_24643 [Dichotomopilus funicola]|uniref:DNA-binding protein RAP1 n=1 Tax=Dichotomopilus funicola TaxID=1934379 RepID=A0AAN6ZRJ2_9PEZI|nr:hypothetical protein C8A04DRAFT_24643 [Dichotomopilus funicola]
MVAPIVYDGVNGNGDGALFNGTKFWVHLRVPQRNLIVEKIKNNGGTVVKLEKIADVLIADHVRKDSPAGSVSWQYITQSVDAGELIDISDYLIHKANDTASTGTRRAIRVPFTKLEEQILVTWLRNAGLDLGASGNLVYQKLEALYPDHTWHSWRSKSIALARLPADQLPGVLAELPPPTARSLVDPADVRSYRAAPTPARVSPAASASVEVKKPRPGSETPRTATPQVSERPARPADPPQAKAPSTHTPAKAPSTHTPRADTPQTRTSPTRSPRSRTPKASTPHAPTPVPATRKPPTSIGDRFRELEQRKRQIVAARQIQAAWRAYQTRKTWNQGLESITQFQARAVGFMVRRALDGLGEENDSNDEKDERGEKDEKGDEDGEPQDTAWFTAPEKSLGGNRELDQLWDHEKEDFLLPGGDAEFWGLDESEPDEQDEQDEKNEQDNPAPPSPSAPKQTQMATTEAEFWLCYNQLNAAYNVKPSPWVQIGQHAVNVWDLWRCARAGAGDGDNGGGGSQEHAARNWEVIAEEMGFDWVREPHMPVRLREGFERYLLELEVYLRRFEMEDEGADDDDEEEEGEEEEEGYEEDEEGYAEGEAEEELLGEAHATQEEAHAQIAIEAATSEDDFISSPPLAALKRVRGSDTPMNSSMRKRARYDPTVEIPETPAVRGQETQRTATAPAPAAGSLQTPTRRTHNGQPVTPRIVFDTQILSESEDAVVTPSQQLRLESSEATFPAQVPTRNGIPPRNTLNLNGTSSTARPLPRQPRLPIGTADDEPESSDGFEPVANVPVRPAPPRRALPWPTTSKPDKGKQPALTTSTSTSTSTSTARNPIMQQQQQQQQQPHRSTSTSTSTPTPTNSKTTPKTLIDPTPILTHFRGQYPDPLIIRAIHATTCSHNPTRTATVLASLSRGDGIPPNLRGVWTAADDTALKGIAPWVKGVMRDLQAVYGGTDGKVDRVVLEEVVKGGRGFRGGDGGEMGERERERVFWGLVGRHGGMGVLRRRGFLEAWERA